MATRGGKYKIGRRAFKKASEELYASGGAAPNTSGDTGDEGKGLDGKRAKKARTIN